MGFLDRARATADDLVSRADQKMNEAGLLGGQPGQPGQQRQRGPAPPAPGQAGGAGDPAAAEKDGLLHELGWLTFQAEQGREAPAGRREEILTRLRELETQPATGAADGQQPPPTPPGSAGPPAGSTPASGGAPPPPPPPPSGG